MWQVIAQLVQYVLHAICYIYATCSMQHVANREEY